MVFAILIGRLDRQERQAIATAVNTTPLIRTYRRELSYVAEIIESGARVLTMNSWDSARRETPGCYPRLNAARL